MEKAPAFGSKLSKFTHSGGSENIITKSFCKNCAAPVTTYVEKWGISRERFDKTH